MRRELAAYREKHPPGKLGAAWLRISSSFKLTFLYQQLKYIPCGSPRWHRLQERLSRRSSVGVDMKLRTLFYETTLTDCGRQPVVHPSCHLSFPQNISFKDDVFLNRGVIITAPATVVIGSNVLIGPYTVINSGNHNFSDPNQLIRKQGHNEAPIFIEDDVWIGAQSTILAGVTIGKGAVIAANAVVNRSVPSYTVVGGVPARKIKTRA